MRKNAYILLSGLACLLLQATSCKVHYRIDDKQTRAVVFRIDSLSVPSADAAALSIIAPYKAAMTAQIEEVLGYAERTMTKDQPEGILNNFVSDAMLMMANRYYQASGGSQIDICLLNNGGLRGNLPKGEIRMSHVYELMPFENKIVVLTLSGAATKSMLDFIAHEGGMPVAGVKFGIKNDKAIRILVNNIPFDSLRTYKIATSDYLADGGDKMSFFKNAVDRIELKQKVRDAIADYLRAVSKDGKPVDPRLDRRVYYE